MTDRVNVQRGTAIGATLAALASGALRPTAAADSMDALVAAAKAEGGVVVDGPPIDATRQAISSGFQTAYGIPVTYISSGSSTSGARVRAERAAGKYLLDVFISGSDTPTLTFLPSGWLDRVEPILVAPDVLDVRKWRNGHLLFEDDAHTILRVIQSVSPQLAVNTSLVKRRELTMWHHLLEPRFTGKFIAKDPSISGAGASLISYFYINFGADFVKKLYVDQKPFISRDPRQAVQALAQGNYAALVGPDPAGVALFQKQGYALAIAFPTDGPDVLTGGWGLVSLLNKAPHPNAAKLFINWFAGRDAQDAFQRTTISASLRTDVSREGLPTYIFPKPGGKYMDTYNYKFVTEERDAAFTRARELLSM
jgi:iron(III) transport system substrate-binding protein